MDLLLCWLIAPALLLAVVIGLSLLVERLAGVAVPAGLRAGLGTAALIVIAQFGTTSGTTAKLTMPAVAVLAAIGIGLGWRRMARQPSPAVIAVGVVVFCLFALPFLAYGAPTWAGYLKLDDTATWMAITEHSFDHGRGLGSLPPSTHEAVAAMYLGKGYPIGGFVPAEALSFFSGRDVAFTLQPAMAFSAAALATALFELVRRPLYRDWTAGAIAICGALSAILLGYYLWGGNKEIVTAGMIALLPGLFWAGIRSQWPSTAYVPLAVVTAAMIAVLGAGAVVWAAPVLVALVAFLVRERGGAVAFESSGRAAMLTVALAIPVLVTPEGIFDPLDPVLTEGSEVSELGGALNPLQVSGLWPALDFRDPPGAEAVVLALAAACLLLAAAGVVAHLRAPGREGLPFAVYACGAAVGAAVIIAFGSPWVDGKAMATVSPAVLTAALAGLAALARKRLLQIAALAAAAAIVGALAWSAFLAYQGVWLAPHDQYQELDEIGERFAGEGPALTTDTSFYGARHFLSELAPESTADVRRRTLVLANGSLLTQTARLVDVDQLQRETLAPYDLLVLPRSPATSRPTTAFELAYRGDYYEVWRRVGAEIPDASLGLGTPYDAGANAPCGRLRGLARAAGPRGDLVAAKVGEPIAVELGEGPIPNGWAARNSLEVDADGPGSLSADFTSAAQAYEVLLGGRIYGHAEVSIDGEAVGSRRAGLYAPGGYTRLATVELGAGDHELELDYEAAGIHPGSGVPARPIGPVLLAAAGEREGSLVRVSPSQYRRLCERRWDWIEAYRPE